MDEAFTSHTPPRYGLGDLPRHFQPQKLDQHPYMSLKLEILKIFFY
jgi:hypothetical protein